MYKEKNKIIIQIVIIVYKCNDEIYKYQATSNRYYQNSQNIMRNISLLESHFPKNICLWLKLRLKHCKTAVKDIIFYQL